MPTLQELLMFSQAPQMGGGEQLARGASSIGEGLRHRKDLAQERELREQAMAQQMAMGQLQAATTMASAQEASRRQMARLDFEREKFDMESERKDRLADQKTIDELSEGLVSIDPAVQQRAIAKARAAGFEVNEEGGEPPQGPAEGPPATAPGAQPEKPTGSPQGGEKPLATMNLPDEYGGRMLGPGERPEWAGDEKPPPLLSAYMAGLGVAPEKPPQEAPPPPPAAPPPRQAAPVPPVPAQPAPRAPVQPRGYVIRKNGQTFRYSPEAISQERATRVAAAYRQQYEKVDVSADEKRATEYGLAAANQGAMMGMTPKEAIEFGNSKRDRYLAEKATSRNVAIAAQSRIRASQAAAPGDALVQYRLQMREIGQRFGLAEIEDDKKAAEEFEGLIDDPNPAAQRTAILSLTRRFQGSRPTDKDVQFSQELAGKFNALAAQFDSWFNGGELPEDYRQKLGEMSGLMRTMTKNRLGAIAKRAYNEVRAYRDMGSGYAQDAPEIAARTITGEWGGYGQGAPRAPSAPAPAAKPARAGKPKKGEVSSLLEAAK